MDIISYRGPSCPGGVSGTISRVLDRHASGRESWWYIIDNTLVFRQSTGVHAACQISDEIVIGHYRYCNEFVWPIMHGLDEHARFSAEDRSAYQKFNLAVASNVKRNQPADETRTNFVQDYQMALIPGFLGSDATRVHLFWHIPWPKKVSAQYLDYVVEIADSMLKCSLLGFHIEEYRTNFLNFVGEHLPEYAVDFSRHVVYCQSDDIAKACEVVVQPLGLDINFWKEEAAKACMEKPLTLFGSFKGHYALSVDRADYSKGVVERLRAIDAFFDMYPDRIEAFTFLQVCQRTRPGLESFDEYWEQCTELVETINKRWSCNDWKPIIWLSDPVSPSVLAELYRNAAVMLVNPVRDGLNLTAKEFVVCASMNHAGVLLLSESAGVWHELDKYAVGIASLTPNRLAETVCFALAMPKMERKRRLEGLRRCLDKNHLPLWWRTFGEIRPLRVSSHECAQSFEVEDAAAVS